MIVDEVCRFDFFCNQLIDWLIDWLIEWLIDWLIVECLIFLGSTDSPPTTLDETTIRGRFVDGPADGRRGRGGHDRTHRGARC